MTDAISIFNAVNGARTTSGATPWRIGDEGNDFEAL